MTYAYTTATIRNRAGKTLLTYNEAIGMIRAQLEDSVSFRTHPKRDRLGEIVLWFFTEMAMEDPAEMADHYTTREGALGCLMDAVYIHGYGWI